MADSSIVTLGTAQSLLVDSSVYDSNYAETTKDHVFLGLASEDNEDLLPRVTRVVLVGEAGRNDALVKAMQTVRVMEVLKMEVVKKKGEPDGEQTLVIKSIVNMEINAQMKTDSIEVFGETDSVQFETVFVLTDFECPDYSDLYKQDKRIIGPPVLLQCAAKEEPLPFSPRPLFATCMLNLSLCLTGFRDKERLRKLVNVVHHMGGSIRKDFSSKVTHLIAHSTHGEKYKMAVVMGRPILTESWISTAWEKRHDISFHAGDPEFRTEFKVPPFQDCVLSFLGFSDEDKANMEERTLKHGGRYLEAGDEKCTHMVVEECSVKELPFIPSTRLFVVKQEWFWGTIQMDARADESMYFYEKSADSPTMKKAVSLLSLHTPNSNRKRRRLRDTLAQLTKDTEVSPFPPPKRHSAERSLSMSLLDISNTPDTCKGLAGENSRPSKSSTPAPAKQSARWQVSKELYQTESNYVDILSTILQLFKVPLEKEGQVGGPILAPEEIKTIFGSIPDIFEVHSKIKADLEEMLTDWSEDRSVGDIILKYSKDLVRCYPAFVNFFEAAKETIVKCERQKPRFHAFLKINQSKPECGRQSLVELLIRPVQRLPSLNLLLNDIKKHTSDDNPDKKSVEKAIDALKEVLTHINEARRMTEGQKQFFDVVYEVDGVPANLLSSHRSLVCRVETIALDAQMCDRGEQVTLFLFNDCLEIARKRHKVLNTFKSPVGQTRPPAHLKHIMLMPLSQIRRVLDLQDTEDCVNAFALLVRPPTEQENMLVSFQLTAEETVKSTWLRSLSRAVANTICRADAEDIIQCTDPDSLQVSTKDMDSTLSKASRAIKKTSKKVTRAFSFTKTPKRVLQRAFMAGSTPDSPRLTSEHRVGSSATLTIMSRSASTFSLNDAKSSAVVQRSNSLDHPPIRARIPVCKRAPDSPTPNPVLSPGPSHNSPTPTDHAVGHRPRSIYHSSASSDHPKSILHSPRPRAQPHDHSPRRSTTRAQTQNHSPRRSTTAQPQNHSPRPSTRAPTQDHSPRPSTRAQDHSPRPSTRAAQPATFSSHPNHTATRAVVRNLAYPTSANPRPKSINSATLSLRLPASQAFLHPNTTPLQSLFLQPPPQSFKGRQSSGISSRDPVVSSEPVKKALASPRRETRL